MIASAAGIVTSATDITPDMLADLEMTLETMELGSLLGLFLQSFLIKFTMLALNIFIFVIVYGRMIEIYLLTSLAPIPVATLSNRELGTMGQNYLRSLFAVGFQGMLILVCVAAGVVGDRSVGVGGNLCGAHSGDRHKRRSHRGDLGLYRLYGASVLHADENRDDLQKHLQRPLRKER